MARAVADGFFDIDEFDLEEYEHLERVENGDLNWITDKFIAFAGPKSKRVCSEGFCTLTPEDYIDYFRRKGVTLVVRLNRPFYDPDRFTRHGFLNHADLLYPDGTVPPRALLDEFLRLCEATPGAVAVHCKAGLGRTGSCIGCYVMKHYRWTAAEFIGWVRIARPGSVIGPQQQWLESMQEEMWAAGQAMDEERERERERRAAAAAAVAAAAAGEVKRPIERHGEHAKALSRVRASAAATETAKDRAEAGLSPPTPTRRARASRMARAGAEKDAARVQTRLRDARGLKRGRRIVRRRLGAVQRVQHTHKRIEDETASATGRPRTRTSRLRPRSRRQQSICGERSNGDGPATEPAGGRSPSSTPREGGGGTASALTASARPHAEDSDLGPRLRISASAANESPFGRTKLAEMAAAAAAAETERRRRVPKRVGRRARRGSTEAAASDGRARRRTRASSAAEVSTPSPKRGAAETPPKKGYFAVTQGDVLRARKSPRTAHRGSPGTIARARTDGEKRSRGETHGRSEAVVDVGNMVECLLPQPAIRADGAGGCGGASSPGAARRRTSRSGRRSPVPKNDGGRGSSLDAALNGVCGSSAISVSDLF
jgi:protein-tyrosine phosphatase